MCGLSAVPVFIHSTNTVLLAGLGTRRCNFIYSFHKSSLSFYRAETDLGAEVTVLNNIDEATALTMHF